MIKQFLKMTPNHFYQSDSKCVIYKELCIGNTYDMHGQNVFV